MGAVRGMRASGLAGRIFAIAVLAAAVPGAAYESDQYSNRLSAISDAAPELNRVTNGALEKIVAGWRGGPDPGRFAREVYRRLGGLHWVDRIERYAMKSRAVEKLPQYRWRSIFRGAPIWATRVNFLFGVGATIRIGDTLVGTDKLGHFISQGLKYYRSRRAGWKEERIVWRGEFNERWIFGQLTTSVYSNADLVANYEGYLFFRSLFEDDVVAGKPRIVSFSGPRPRLERLFDWRDHVNDYWDEALHPSFLSPALGRYFQRTLPRLCADFRRAPESYVPADDARLSERYAHIGLRAAPGYRVDRVCATETPPPDPVRRAALHGR